MLDLKMETRVCDGSPVGGSESLNVPFCPGPSLLCSEAPGKACRNSLLCAELLNCVRSGPGEEVWGRSRLVLTMAHLVVCHQRGSAASAELHLLLLFQPLAEVVHARASSLNVLRQGESYSVHESLFSFHGVDVTRSEPGVLDLIC